MLPQGIHPCREARELVEQDRLTVPCIRRFLKATVELLAEFVL